METENCDPPKVDDWSEVSILEVVLSAQDGIPGAKAELARREKEGQALDKSADITKNNPYRDPRTGQFTYGAGGPQSGGGGGGSGAEDDDGAESGAGNAGETAKGKDITSELADDYGKDVETKRGTELKEKDMDPGTRGDPTLQDIAKKQGFDGEAEIVGQATFDEVVAKGGTVTYRGITPHFDGPGPDAAYIEGDAAVTEQFSEGSYFAGIGVYGNGTYTSVDKSVATHYATEDGAKGSVVTMAIKPTARIATPEQWEATKLAAKEGKGGFMGANDEGRILAAQGYDGFVVAPKDSEHWAAGTIVVLNRTALVVLKP